MTENIFNRIKEAINKDDVVLFMKGTPEQPQCGFSATVVKILAASGVAVKAYDILQDEELRQGIKDFADWPTIPQLYIKGEFIGGCDIVREMYQNGELASLLTAKHIISLKTE